METELPPLITVADIVERYRVHDETVHAWIANGELVAFKLGHAWRITPEDWQDFLGRRRGAAGGDELEDAAEDAPDVVPRARPRRRT